MVRSKLIVATSSTLAVLALALATPAEARHCRRARRARPPVACMPAPALSPMVAIPAGVSVATPADPATFLDWLNARRAAVGLAAVGYDPGLATWAQLNNDQQQARGMGHHVFGPARRQNSGMGDYGTVLAMWMASPAHQAALLDPTIIRVALAQRGAYWTFAAY